MPRATKHVSAASRTPGRVVDTLILTYAQRTAQRGFLFGVNGTCIELDFAEPVRLRTDDALMLDDGNLAEVVAEAEPLIEMRAADPSSFARLAWHLGDRHVPIEVKANRLRMRRDPAIEKLLHDLDVKLIAIEAPFEPEDGAYAVAGHLHHEHAHHDHHPHGHHHEHDHDHDHDHTNDHHHGHDHKRD
jgi:urease accessory protein